MIRGEVVNPCTSAQHQRHAQFVAEGFQKSLDAFDPARNVSAQDGERDADDFRAQSQSLRRLQPRADPARRDQIQTERTKLADAGGGRNSPVPEGFAQMSHRAIADRFDPDPRSPPGARNVNPFDSRTAKFYSRFAPKAGAGLFDDNWQRRFADQPPDGVERTAKVMIAVLLNDLHRRVHVDAHRVGAYLLGQPRHFTRAQFARLRHADVAEQQDVRRDVAHLKSLHHFRMSKPHALRTHAETDAHSVGQRGYIPVEPRHLFRASGHPGDDQRIVQTFAERDDAQIDVFEPGFDQRLMNQFDIFEESGLPAELHVLVRAEVEMIELAIDNFS